MTTNPVYMIVIEAMKAGLAITLPILTRQGTPHTYKMRQTESGIWISTVRTTDRATGNSTYINSYLDMTDFLEACDNLSLDEVEEINDRLQETL